MGAVTVTGASLLDLQDELGQVSLNPTVRVMVFVLHICYSGFLRYVVKIQICIWYEIQIFYGTIFYKIQGGF